MMKLIPIGLIALMVAGCASGGLPPSSTAPICDALIGPIKYNTYNKSSRRYAAALLAMDLKKRNQVGQRLGCGAFK